METLNQFYIFLEKYPFLHLIFWGNEIRNYLVSLIVFVLVFVALRIFRKIILKRIKEFIKKAKNGIGDTLVLILDSIKPSFYWFLAFYAAVNLLNLSDVFSRIVTAIMLVWIAYYAVIAAQFFIDYALDRKFKKENDPGTKEALTTVGKFAKALLWLFGALLVLSNMGINITSLMAGLGIGGIAIAFALQNILDDLFSSFAIYFDKPFVPGDFIIIGDYMGVVEKIGVKTTRLRALQGEEIVVSNRELTTAKIQNFKKMKKRRVVFNFGIVYDTPGNKLRKVGETVTKIITEEKLSEFDRVNFIKFGDFSLNFEAVYYILSGDYTEFANTHENILFKIKEKFEKEKISMAFPTQTVYVDKKK